MVHSRNIGSVNTGPVATVLPLGYVRVYLPFPKAAATPFHIQVDEILFLVIRGLINHVFADSCRTEETFISVQSVFLQRYHSRYHLLKQHFVEKHR